jgi:hypothetical protein
MKLELNENSTQFTAYGQAKLVREVPLQCASLENLRLDLKPFDEPGG